MSQVLTSERTIEVPVRVGRVVARASALGGIAFVALLVVQNALRASEPAADASAAAVARYFSDERTRALLAIGLFPLGLLALGAFVAGVWLRGERTPGAGPWWARLGVLGGALVAALFAVVNVVDLTLLARPGGARLTLPLVHVLWVLHNAAFALNFAAIGVALLGLGHASVASGVAPRWIAWVADVGAVLLLVPAVLALALLDGGPWIGLAFAGFLAWALFVVVTSVGMLRSE